MRDFESQHNQGTYLLSPLCHRMQKKKTNKHKPPEYKYESDNEYVICLSDTMSDSEVEKVLYLSL